MGKIVLGRQVIDTGPCTDAQPNFAELSNVLEALGNPSLDPGPGPLDPDGEPTETGDTVENVYVDEDGDLVYINEDGDIELIEVIGGGTGTEADTKTFYNLVWGTPDPADGDFDMEVVEVHDAITVHVPKDTSPNPSPNPAPLPGTTISVTNSPNIVWLNDDPVYARYDHVKQRWDTDCCHNWVAIARGRPEWDKAKTQVLLHDADSNAIEWSEGEEVTVVSYIKPEMDVSIVGGNLQWKITFNTKRLRMLADAGSVETYSTGTFSKTEC